MLNLDLLLNGDPITVKQVGVGQGVFKLLVAATVALAIGSVGLYVHNNTDTISDKGVLTSLKDTISSTIEYTIEKKYKTTAFPIYTNSKLVNEKNQALLNGIGNFDIEKGLADNQIARQVSKIQFSTKNYFLSLVSEGEGFRSHIYNDNIGFALGNGWNISMQSKQYNTELIKSVYKDPSSVNSISILSGKESNHVISKNELNTIVIAPQRSMQIAELMGEKFESGVIEVIAKQMARNQDIIKMHKDTKKEYKQLAIEMYLSLQPNEKAAVLYHCYKVGEHGFSKYSGMIDSLITYSFSNKKTPEMRKTIADKFTYKYKMNGKVLEDTRASLLVGTMFASTEAFGYIIGKNVAPHNISSLTTALKTNNITGSEAPGAMVIADPVSAERAKIEAMGGEINIQVLPDVNLDIHKMKPSTKAHLPYGYL